MPIASINGAQLYYEVHGSGPPLILSHTANAGAASWRNNIPDLSKKLQVVVYDRRDVGQSKAPPESHSAQTWVEDVGGLMNHLGLRRAYVGGVSYGMMITLGFLLAHPDRVKGAILIAGLSEAYPGRGQFKVAFPDRTNDLASIRRPALIIHGTKDQVFPPSMAEYTRDRIPGVECAILAGGSHSLHAEDADVFNSLVLGWITKQELKEG